MVKRVAGSAGIFDESETQLLSEAYRVALAQLRFAYEITTDSRRKLAIIVLKTYATECAEDRWAETDAETLATVSVATLLQQCGSAATLQ